MFVGRETSPKKSTDGANKFVTGTDTSEIGCGPDETKALPTDLIKAADDKSLDSKDKATPRKEQIDTQQSIDSENDSELAENLVQKTYVKKKADRLIKEFQTESDNEAEIE